MQAGTMGTKRRRYHEKPRNQVGRRKPTHLPGHKIAGRFAYESSESTHLGICLPLESFRRRGTSVILAGNFPQEFSIPMSPRTRGLLAAIILSLPAWAASSSVPGIRNFGQINQNVYRGAQPTDDGVRYLAKIGVKVLLDLRGPGERSTSEEQLAAALGMRYVNVPMSGLIPPTAAETDAVLALLENPANGPVFVHCRRGADRTGAVIAAYRIEHDGWNSDRALKEAVSWGMSPWQFPRKNYIRAFHPRPMSGTVAKYNEAASGSVTSSGDSTSASALDGGQGTGDSSLVGTPVEAH